MRDCLRPPRLANVGLRFFRAGRCDRIPASGWRRFPRGCRVLVTTREFESLCSPAAGKALWNDGIVRGVEARNESAAKWRAHVFGIAYEREATPFKVTDSEGMNRRVLWFLPASSPHYSGSTNWGAECPGLLELRVPAPG